MLRRIDSGPALVSLLGRSCGSDRPARSIGRALRSHRTALPVACWWFVPLGLDLARVVNPDGDTPCSGRRGACNPCSGHGVIAFWLHPAGTPPCSLHPGLGLP